ncbi:MAG: dTDP-4-dehydrorhamnose 3,5-epimerase [Burkholderiales bacterium]|nr:dTDP-4-dehydrorhamnose 3,5-epimerase [Burkholderiales bacterium]
MIFTETRLAGAFVIELEKREDERGFFARTFCAREFESHGLKPTVAQCNVSYNKKKGTLRGMHYQAPPAAEAKLVRCTNGAIHDVIIDMRQDSPTYLQYFGLRLTVDNRRAIYIPELFAHGLQTLTDDAEVFYQMSEFHIPGHERGQRYNDPAFNIEWPLAVAEINTRDASWPLLNLV